jgi:AbiV family abortive infection protein
MAKARGASGAGEQAVTNDTSIQSRLSIWSVFGSNHREIAMNTVTAETLLNGAILSAKAALEFLRDANSLYQEGRFASACIIGANAREHLGRAMQLFEMLYKLTINKRTMDIKTFKKKFEQDHEAKLRSSVIFFQAEVPSSLSMIQLKTLDPKSRKFQGKREEMNKLIHKQMNQQPQRIHSLRCEAQYVDLCSDGSKWNQPSKVDRSKVYDMLQSTGYCYRQFLKLNLTPICDFESRCRQLGLWEILNDVSGTLLTLERPHKG